MLGLLAITAIPTTIGIAQGVSAQKRENRDKDDAVLLRKFNLECWCEGQGRLRNQFHGGRVVLGDEKVCLVVWILLYY